METFFYTVGRGKKPQSLVASDEKSFWELVALRHPGKKITLGVDVVLSPAAHARMKSFLEQARMKEK